MTKRQQDPKRTQLFVVRLWSESFDRGRRVWRGEIVHVATESRHNFARWQDLLAFLCNTVGVPWEGNVQEEITAAAREEEPTGDEQET